VFDAAAVVDDLERSRVTTVWLAPAMVNAIMALPDIDQRDPGQLGSADTPRLQQTHQAGFAELADRIIGTAAQRVGKGGARFEPRHHGTRTRQGLIGREYRLRRAGYDFGGQWRLKRQQRPALVRSRMPGN